MFNSGAGCECSSVQQLLVLAKCMIVAALVEGISALPSQSPQKFCN